jgi:dTDP-4-dehydrorhamnose 3,5-epimerase
MKTVRTSLPGVVIIEPEIRSDARGLLMETYSRRSYAEKNIVEETFVQDNLSCSKRGVIRGLHFQNPHKQGKLVYAAHGDIFDVAVDIRRGSPTFACWVGQRLSGDSGRQMYIPPGFAHGFVALSETALFIYKCTDYYDETSQGAIAWNDPKIGIDWPLDAPVLSKRDANAPTLEEIDQSLLPVY